MFDNKAKDEVFSFQAQHEKMESNGSSSLGPFCNSCLDWLKGVKAPLTEDGDNIVTEDSQMRDKLMFARGRPRIVLMVDDLDRCDPANAYRRS